VSGIEDQLRAALRADRDEYVPSPDLPARILAHTKRRSDRQRRLAAASALMAAALVGGTLTLQRGATPAGPPVAAWFDAATSSALYAYSEASDDAGRTVAPTAEVRAGDGPAGLALVKSDRSSSSRGKGSPGEKSSSERSTGKRVKKSKQGRDTRERRTTATPDTTATPGTRTPAVIPEPSEASEEATANTGALTAAVSVGNAAASPPVPAVDAAALPCEVAGPAELLVGETGTWTAVQSGSAPTGAEPGAAPTAEPYARSWDTPGTYEVVLTVRDAGGQLLTCGKQVTVVQPPADPATGSSVPAPAQP
jgi:hypothetical protein